MTTDNHTEQTKHMARALVDAGKLQEAVDLVVDRLPLHPLTRDIIELWTLSQMDADEMRRWIEGL